MQIRVVGVVGVTLLLILSLSGVHAQTAVNATYGVPFVARVSGATTRYMLYYPPRANAFPKPNVTGAVLDITVSKNCSIVLAAYQPPNTLELAAGYMIPAGGGVDIGAGYQLSVEPISALKAPAVLRSSNINARFSELLDRYGPNVTTGCLHLNQNDEVLSFIPTKFVNSTLTVNLPSNGSFAFVALKKVISYNPSWPQAVYYPYSNVTYDWTNGIKISFWSPVSNKVETSFRAEPTQGTIEASDWAPALKAWVTVTVEKPDAPYVAVLSYDYTAAQVLASKVRDQSRLRFAYFDPAVQKWQLPESGGSVNATLRVVTQVIPTFRYVEWGVYEVPLPGSAKRSAAEHRAPIIPTMLFLTMVLLPLLMSKFAAS